MAYREPLGAGVRVLSLFAGIGMFDYAWKQLGWETVAFAEMDKFCQKVLEKHYPGVPIYDDVRDVTYERLKEDGIVGNPDNNGSLGMQVQEDGARGCGRQTEEIKQFTRPGDDVPDTISKPSKVRRDDKADAEEGGIRRAHKAGSRADDSGLTGTGKNGANGAPNQPAGIDLICAGWPCQDMSVAGKQKGIIHGERSSLWNEVARIAGELRPRYLILENVSALLSGGDLVDSASGPVYRTWFGRVLRDLAQIGYDCEWHCISAGNADGRLSAGAPHRRERVWIIAYPNKLNDDNRGYGTSEVCRKQSGQAEILRSKQTLSNDNGHRLDQGWQGVTKTGGNGPIGNTGRPTEPSLGLLAHGIAAGLSRSRWLPEPGIGRVATGVPDRVNKLKALGNGLVWQIPFAIGQAIEMRERYV